MLCAYNNYSSASIICTDIHINGQWWIYRISTYSWVLTAAFLIKALHNWTSVWSHETWARKGPVTCGDLPEGAWIQRSCSVEGYDVYIVYMFVCTRTTLSHTNDTVYIRDQVAYKTTIDLMTRQIIHTQK